MRIIIAPNAFKGSLTAFDAAAAIQAGILRVIPDATCVLLPIADGGDGTSDVLVKSLKGRFVECAVSDPLGKPITASFGLLPDNTAVIEMANASGLRLITANQRNPLITTTYGTGQLVQAALESGARKIIIGIGGSATVDGGAGLAQALGARLLNEQGEEIAHGGGALADLHHIDISGLDARLKDCEIIAACDVNNPLVGEMGAARIFGPQKGATPEMVEQLDANLTHYAQIIARDLGVNVLDVPGGGAAGGLAAGLIAFCGARLQSGIDLVLDTLAIDQHLASADLVITGEGQIDGQTAHGKAPAGLAARAQRYGLPVVALAGSVVDDSDELLAHGFAAILPIVPRPMPLDEAMSDGAHLLQEAAARMMRLILLRQTRRS